MQTTQGIRRHTGASPGGPGLGRPIHWEYLLVPVLLVLAVGLWELVVRWGEYQPFILPAPRRVAARFAAALADGTLVTHTLVTLREVFAGLALGLSVAVVLGYILAKSRLLERIISPYLVASQAIPVVALAPLLVIWFGAGSFSKVLVCALTPFFRCSTPSLHPLGGPQPDGPDALVTRQRWQVPPCWRCLLRCPSCGLNGRHPVGDGAVVSLSLGPRAFW